VFDPRDESPFWKTAPPLTYIIDYSPDHVGNDSWIQKLAESAPVLLHVGHDVPFKSMYGPADGYDYASRRMPDPKEIDDRIETLSQHISKIHAAGVRLVIPYICSMFMFGDPGQRSGFWRFYDNWDRYSRFGFGSKPETDPVKWCYEKPRPLDIEIEGLDGRWVYEPCINNPDWRRFLRTVVGHIAKVGYDGVFVDVNATTCSKVCCRKLFWEYLRTRYTAGEMIELFGFDKPTKVRLGKRGQGLLWVETVRFRGERMSSLFSELRSEGRRYRETFIVIPNLSPYQHVDGVWKRVGNSQVLSSWARECPLIMFEEMQQPGLLAPGIVSNFVFQYKYAFAQSVRAGCLLYNAQDEPGVELSIAEAAAGGGGALIQAGYSCPEVRRKYREFFSKHADIYRGLVPHSDVGLVFFYDELAWGTRSHLENTYRVAEELMARHVLFDVLVERSFVPEKLEKYKVIIACDLQHLSAEQTSCVEKYLEGGGALLAAGSFGAFDERGRPRRGDALDSFGNVGGLRRSNWIKEATVGKGRFVAVVDLKQILSRKPFELFMISEDDSLDLGRIKELASSAKAGGERKRALLEQLERLAGTLPISECEETLRFNAFRTLPQDGRMLTLHCANYNVPILDRGRSGPPIPTEPATVRLPLPSGWEVEAVELFNPPEPQARGLDYQVDGDNVVLKLPPVSVYSVVKVACRS